MYLGRTGTGVCGVEVRRRIQAVANAWRKVNGAGLMIIWITYEFQKVNKEGPEFQCSAIWFDVNS